MSAIKDGTMKVHRKKKMPGHKNVVLQSSFKCLIGKHPIKDDEEIFQILTKYKNGDLEDAPKRKAKMTQKTASNDSSNSLVRKHDSLLSQLPYITSYTKNDTNTLYSDLKLGLRLAPLF